MSSLSQNSDDRDRFHKEWRTWVEQAITLHDIEGLKLRSDRGRYVVELNEIKKTILCLKNEQSIQRIANGVLRIKRGQHNRDDNSDRICDDAHCYIQESGRPPSENHSRKSGGDRDPTIHI